MIIRYSAHCRLLCRQNDPVYAIVLSGGYKDDADGQKEIIYTGMGGQKNGVQVSAPPHCVGDPSDSLSCRNTPQAAEATGKYV